MSLSSPTTAPGSPTPPAERLATLPEGEPTLTLGYEAAAWAHEWLVQPNGPRARQPFRLTLDQFRFLLWWYSVDEEGRWLYGHGARRLAKGSGKSPFAAVLALIEFCGPVRLLDFAPSAPGGCVGRPVDMPLVQIAATAESQTANTMRMVRAFAPKGSRLVDAYNLDPGKTRYYKLPEGTLEVITSSVTAAEGAESSFVIGDETEHWKPSNGGPDLASTLADNLAKSGNRMLETSNAWVPGAETVAEATWDDWVAQEEGRLVGETKILYDARIAPPDTDLRDPDSLRTALEWVYADCDWKRRPDGTVDVWSVMERIRRPSAKPDDSRRKYLDLPAVSASAWVKPEQWALLAASRKLGHPRLVDLSEEVVLFFDGSTTRDATALVGCCMSDGHVFTVGVWEPDTAHNADDVVDVADVDRVVRKAAEGAYGKVVGFFGDVKEWESFVKIEWPLLFPNLRVKAGTTKDPQPIAWDMRGHVFEFTRECELVEAEIRDGLFTHDSHPAVARHVANAHRDANRYGVSIKKGTSAKKIDAAVCVIGARMVRRLVLATKPVKPRSGRVY